MKLRQGLIQNRKMYNRATQNPLKQDINKRNRKTKCIFKKDFVFITILIITLHLFFIPVSADGLHLKIEKIVERDKDEIKVGDDVTILLKFMNPFGREIPVKIVDKNIFGNNGLDIQCLEYTLSSEKEIVVAYDPIKPYQGGEFVIPPAKVTYTNPDTGKVEEIESNILNIRVNDTLSNQNAPSQPQLQSQGITTIYQCNGVSMRSVSYSTSGGSFNINIGGQQVQQGQIGGSQSSGAQGTQNNVQNNQLNQNTNVLKKEIEEKKRIEKEFQENILGDSDVQKMMDELSNSGYDLINSSFNPATNNTGSFEFNYQKPNGESATIKGEMEEGKLKNLASLTDEDKIKIMDALERDVTFRDLDRILREKGFNRSQPVFNLISQNHTQIEVLYVNEKGEIAEITAEYVNGSVRDVTVNKEGVESDSIWLYLLMLPLLGVLGYFSKMLLDRMNRKDTEITDGILESPPPHDYLKEAKGLLDSAELMYENQDIKSAFENISKAIRVYYANRLNLDKEIDSSELLEIYLPIDDEGFDEIKECLDICTSVEFAKYTPERSHFERAVEIARKYII